MLVRLPVRSSSTLGSAHIPVGCLCSALVEDYRCRRKPPPLRTVCPLVADLLRFSLLKTLLWSLQLQPNSYYTFYDDHMQNWSITFESEKSSSDFCREVSEGHSPLRRGASEGLVSPRSSAPSRCVWLKPTAPPPWTLHWSRI